MSTCEASVLAFFVCGICLWSANTMGGAEAPGFTERPISELEEYLQVIDDELAQLAENSLRSGIGAIGYRSAAHDQKNNVEWIEIDLGSDFLIDEVVLVPTIWRHPTKGFQADAFPARFKILTGSTDDSAGSVIVDSDSLGHILPRIAPLRIPTHGARGSWLRVEASELSTRAFDGRHVFQLAEIFVFQQKDNLALSRPLRTSSNVNDSAGAWDERFLVDGFTPYLMNAAVGDKSLAYVSQQGTLPELQIDLGQVFELSSLNFHAVEQSDTVPQAYAGNLGIPRHMVVEGALKPDFSDARRLLEYRQEKINDTGPIIMRRFAPTPSRYVRFSPQLPSFQSFQSPPELVRLGFAEIELFSEGHNVAIGREVTSHPVTRIDAFRSLSSLTDGHNLYGQILSVRDWLEELSRRHELETERPVVTAELSLRYARQQQNLTRTSWLAAALAVGIGFILLLGHILRLRQAAGIKQRFAADLHDELGADLHTIGLLCDLAKDSVDSRDEMLELLDRIRVFTQRSGMAARYCTDMLEAKGLCEDLVDEMKRTSRRMLADLEHDLHIEGEPVLQGLSPRRRIDLFLFYKESLTNIIRHSGATRVTTHIIAREQDVTLNIADNGHGVENVSPPQVPASLERRARLLRAQVALKVPPAGGTRITLKLNTRKFRLL
jgi:signal transduction histidine kinase